jgi:hypothetical protein
MRFGLKLLLLAVTAIALALGAEAVRRIHLHWP